MEHQKELIYSANIPPVKCKHYWGCHLNLFYEEPYWEIELTDIYVRDRYNDDEIKRSAILPETFPDVSVQELKKFIEEINCSGPNQGYETPYREIKELDVEKILQAAKIK